MKLVGKKSTTKIRVRYSETDKMGYVYYGNYAQYCEIGRTECMKEFGISYKELETHNIMLPVVHYESKFLRPAFYDDLLTLETELTDLTDHIIVFRTDIYNEDKKLLNRGIVKLCFVDAHTRQKVKVPHSVLKRIESTPSS